MSKHSLKEAARRLLPRGIKSHRIWAGRLKGMRIVTSWHDYPGAITGRTERALLEWFTRVTRSGETWLDVGAHYGYTSLALSRLVGSNGRVFGFEPILSTAACLAQTRSLNGLQQLTVLPFGLSTPETVELRLVSTVRGMADATLETGSATGAVREEIVLARFDWLWPRICGERPQLDGVKIDAQGMELEVLQGMAETITRHRPKLVIELHRGVSRPILLEFVESLGYDRAGASIEPERGQREAGYLDDRSYVFRPAMSGSAIR